MDHVHELETPAAPGRSRDTLILEELGLAPSRASSHPSSSSGTRASWPRS